MIVAVTVLKDNKPPSKQEMLQGEGKTVANHIHIHTKNDETNRGCDINQEHDTSNSIEDPVLQPGSRAEMA
jgi:hypothetical protein